MRLTGTRCQCAGCKRYFSSTSHFEAHRMGDYGVDRRCGTDAELQAKGLEQTLGVWYKPMTEDQREALNRRLVKHRLLEPA